LQDLKVFEFKHPSFLKLEVLYNGFIYDQ